jgi:hypothetical protein
VSQVKLLWQGLMNRILQNIPACKFWKIEVYINKYVKRRFRFIDFPFIIYLWSIKN